MYEILSTMSTRLLSPQPLALPGSGCTLAQVLASAERGRELATVLALFPRLAETT